VNDIAPGRVLDDLFSLARRYRSSTEYCNLMSFISRFRFYSPFNATLIHVQMPGARFVAPPRRWVNEYRRRIKPESSPKVILQPMGPVMFVFDVSETEPEPNAPALPDEVVRPFEVRSGQIGNELGATIENAKRDGVRVSARRVGSQSAGEIHTVQTGGFLDVLTRVKPSPVYLHVPLRYELLINGDHSPETQYSTLVHELGHLYCGHLGTPDPSWWPHRKELPATVQEFEAESVSYLVCTRVGIDTPSHTYLAHYFQNNEAVPDISLECVMTASGLIESMGRRRLRPRKAPPR
jgi:IrrE N-terminal-like domain